MYTKISFKKAAKTRKYSYSNILNKNFYQNL